MTQLKCSDSIFCHRVFWLLVIVTMGAGADQASKYWAQNTLARPVEYVDSGVQKVKYIATQEIIIIPQAFSLIYRENSAAAFSLTKSIPEWVRRPLLVLISMIASLFFLIWYIRMKDRDYMILTSFCLVMAGAVGNLIDRVRLGYVVDFLDVYLGFTGIQNSHWPTFNIADSCIVIGAIGIAYRAIWPLKTTDVA